MTPATESLELGTRYAAQKSQPQNWISVVVGRDKVPKVWMARMLDYMLNVGLGINEKLATNDAACRSPPLIPGIDL
jgi:hypothetical protein